MPKDKPVESGSGVPLAHRSSQTSPAGNYLTEKAESPPSVTEQNLHAAIDDYITYTQEERASISHSGPDSLDVPSLLSSETARSLQKRILTLIRTPQWSTLSHKHRYNTYKYPEKKMDSRRA